MRKWLAVLVLVAGCGGAVTDVTGGPDTWPGAYDLGAINGSALPYFVSNFGNTLSNITSGELLLTATGSFSATVNQTNVDPAGARTVTLFASSGTWVAAGDSLKLSTVGGVFLRGRVVGNVAALTDPGGVVYAWVRRR